MLGKEQYSRREWLENSGIPDSISQKNLASKVCDIFHECNADIEPVNIEACHHLKSNHWPRKVIVKLVKRKDASKRLRGKKKLNTTGLSQKSFLPTIIVFINESLGSYYRFLWLECKKIWSKKSIASFWYSNGPIWIKGNENFPAILLSTTS